MYVWTLTFRIPRWSPTLVRLSVPLSRRLLCHTRSNKRKSPWVYSWTTTRCLWSWPQRCNIKHNTRKCWPSTRRLKDGQLQRNPTRRSVLPYLLFLRYLGFLQYLFEELMPTWLWHSEFTFRALEGHWNSANWHENCLCLFTRCKKVCKGIDEVKLLKEHDEHHREWYYIVFPISIVSHCSVSSRYFSTKPYFPFAPRDYHVARHDCYGEKQSVLVGFSVVSEEVPHVKGFVRGNLMASGYFIDANDDGTVTTTLLIHSDPKGEILWNSII